MGRSLKLLFLLISGIQHPEKRISVFTLQPSWAALVLLQGVLPAGIYREATQQHQEPAPRNLKNSLGQIEPVFSLEVGLDDCPPSEDEFCGAPVASGALTSPWRLF